MEVTPATAPAPAPRSIGERLRAGRERAGLSVAAAAEKLHLDNRVIEALEADRFAELGASVYVRGHLRRYGDFVGEQGAELVSAYSAREARPPPPDLTRVPHAERRSDPRRLVTPLVGAACALVLALAIWWVLAGSHAAKSPTAETMSPGPAVPAVTAAAPPPVRVAAAVPAAAPAVATEPAANSERRETIQDTTPIRPTHLRLELSGESWVEVYDARGARLFYDVASAGSVQSIEGRPPLRVVLGNAAGVSVQVDGETREVPANAVNGEGARFVVNRSGSLTRARP
jgi:cytoskeleton protein RodZ